MQKIDPKPTWSPPPDGLDLQPDQVDVWRIPLDLPTASVKSLESILSADERDRAARFRFPEGKDRYIVAHGCLHNILAHYLGCEPGQLSFSNNEYGKPALSGHQLEFNLSHSGNFALVAVSQGRKVGVDVERIRSDVELERIAGRYFSKSEVTELMALAAEQRTAGFFNCWARKEAYIKAQGWGFSMSLDSFDVSLTPHEPALLRATRPDAQEAARWTLLSLEVDPGYAAAVAIAGKDLKFRSWDWNTSYASA
jgi:4'-phosphopantetheinyl transferase